MLVLISLATSRALWMTRTQKRKALSEMVFMRTFPKNSGINKTVGQQFVWSFCWCTGQASLGVVVALLPRTLSHRLRRFLSFPRYFPTLLFLFVSLNADNVHCTNPSEFGGRIFLHVLSLMLPSVLHNSCWLGDLSIRQLDPALGKFQTNLRNAETQIAFD